MEEVKVKVVPFDIRYSIALDAKYTEFPGVNLLCLRIIAEFVRLV